MKPVIIIVIAVVCSVTAVLGVLYAINLYNISEYEKAINRIQHEQYKQQELASKAEEARHQAQQGVIQIIKEWINGDGLVKTVYRLEEAKKRSTKSSEILDDIRTYLGRKCNDCKQLQEELRDDLEIAKNAVQDLKKFLEGKSPKEEGK